MDLETCKNVKTVNRVIVYLGMSSLCKDHADFRSKNLPQVMNHAQLSGFRNVECSYCTSLKNPKTVNYSKLKPIEVLKWSHTINILNMYCCSEYLDYPHLFIF